MVKPESLGDKIRGTRFRFKLLSATDKRRENVYQTMRKLCEQNKDVDWENRIKSVTKQQDDSLVMEWREPVQYKSAQQFLRLRVDVSPPYVLLSMDDRKHASGWRSIERVLVGEDKRGKKVKTSWANQCKLIRAWIDERRKKGKYESGSFKLPFGYVCRRKTIQRYQRDWSKAVQRDRSKALAIKGEEMLKIKQEVKEEVFAKFKTKKEPGVKTELDNRAKAQPPKVKASRAESLPSAKRIKVEVETSTKRTSSVASNVQEPSCPSLLWFIHKLVLQKQQPDKDMKNKLFSDYFISEELGRGVHGSVHLATCNKTDTSLAIKLFSGVTCFEKAVREISTLQAVSGHPNVISLVDVACSDLTCAMILEQGGKTNLRSRLRLQTFTVQMARKATSEILSALAHIHERKIIHNDLKPANITLASDGGIRLIDFGNSIVDERGCRPTRTLEETKKEGINQISLWYRAVEVLLGQDNYSSAVDIWSCGCIVAEMVSGSVFFHAKNPNGMILEIFRRLGSPVGKAKLALQKLPLWQEDFPVHTKTELSPELSKAPLSDFLISLLNMDPGGRATAHAALQHEWFQKPLNAGQAAGA